MSGAFLEIHIDDEQLRNAPPVTALQRAFTRSVMTVCLAEESYDAEREVPMLLAKAPAILVGCTSIPDLQSVGIDKWRATLRWALFVLGADTAVTERHDAALDTVFDLLLDGRRRQPLHRLFE